MQNWGAFLATRDRGREVRSDIETVIRGSGSGEYIVLDFDGIQEITVSFGDECVAKLLVDRSADENADWSLALANLNDEVLETLGLVLGRRKLAAAVIGPAGLGLVGDNGWLGLTLDVAAAMGIFRANDLAERLGLTAQAANNRLRQLVATGAVRRERVVPDGGGKEFVYHIAIPEQEHS